MRVSAPQPLTRPCGGVRHRAPDVGGERAIGAFKAAWARGPFPGSAGLCCLTSPEPYALSNLVISTWHRVDTERSAVPGPGPPGSGPLLALEQQQEFWPVFPAQSLMLHSKLAGGRAGSPHLDLRARLCFLLPRVSLCNPRSEKTRGCEVRKRRPGSPAVLPASHSVPRGGLLTSLLAVAGPWRPRKQAPRLTSEIHAKRLSVCEVAHQTNELGPPEPSSLRLLY